MSELVKRNQTEIAALRPSFADELLDPFVARRLVAKFLKRKYQMVAVFLIVFVPAAISTFLATPLYRSTALVQVNPDPAQVLPYRDVADTVLGTANTDTYLGTQEQLLRGSALRTRVAGRLTADFEGQPASQEAGMLGGRFNLRRIERSDLFELSYVAPSPELAALTVNLYAEEFVKQNFEMRQATRLKAEADLRKELEAFEQRMQLSERELTSYAQSNQIMSLEQGQIDPLQERLRALTEDMASAETAVSVAESAYQILQVTTIEDFPQRLVTDQIRQLEGRLLQLEQELTALRGTFGENWPTVVEKRTETTLVRDQLLSEKRTALARNLEQARLDLEGADSRRDTTAQALEEQTALVNQFHNASIQYNILKREVDANGTLYDGLLGRLRQTGVMAGFQFGNIQVIEPGQPSRVVDSPRVVMNLATAALLGLTLGVCLVLLLEFWDNTITTLDEVEQIGSVPSLGSVPVIKSLKPKAPAGLLRARTNGNGKPAEVSLAKRNGEAASPILAGALPFELSEAMRAICASLLLSRSDARPRVIAVTSATSSEGKTTLVTHLGRAFAEAGMTTLVIEADLRKPDLSKAFEVGNEDGLSLYLAGHVSPWPKIHETAIPNLFIAAGGPIPPNPVALLHSERLPLFLKAAASDYQIVLVDSPPLSLADARILGTKADGVVLVVRAGQTAKNLVRRAWSMLEASGANGLGMVLNGEEADPTEGPYHSYYYSRGQA